MASAEDIAWFKQQFVGDIMPRLAGTPFDLDMITAIACQETGHVWSVLRRKNLSIDRILALCVGDTNDRTSTFPRHRADLEAAPNGEAMFAIARRSLIDMAQHVPGYSVMAKNPAKFCHGYGIFQYDLQFFRTDPEFFLQQQWGRMDLTISRCLAELARCLQRNKLTGRTALTDLEMASVAIAYNCGAYKVSAGLKQGYFNKADRRYYGESWHDYLQLARTVGLPGGPPPTVAPATAGTAIVRSPTPVASTGDTYRVEVSTGLLNVRDGPNGRIEHGLPDGQLVRALARVPKQGFLHIETNLRGAHIVGYASMRYLRKVTQPLPPTPHAAPTPPTSGIVAVWTPRRDGSVTRRRQPANAMSLNEPGQPGRKGVSADALRNELAAIIDWLAVDNAAHKRYQPHTGSTFCNIYAHDYCHLAGAYLPRTWWTAVAIERLARGEPAEPGYGATIEEMCANDLFGWLRDFGLRFGWRQTGTLTSLQGAVNQGALGLLVARRKDDRKSGHIVAVVPEIEDQRARRTAEGNVTAPLQSQAGTRNFRYGTGVSSWWLGEQFAESGFWIHA